MIRRNLVLLSLLLASTSLAAPFTITVDKACGIVSGKDRFNLGSNIKPLLKKFGQPERVDIGKEFDDDGQPTGDLGYKTLYYDRLSMDVEYHIRTGTILNIMIDLEQDPTFSLTGGPRLNASPEQLLPKLGKANISDYSSRYNTLVSNCTVSISRQIGSRAYFSLRAPQLTRVPDNAPNTAPVSLTVDKTCGLVRGKDRFDLGSNVDLFIKKFGKPTEVSSSKAEDGLVKSDTLYYPKGLAISHEVKTRKITEFYFRLYEDPTYSLTGGPRLTTGPQRLKSKLGNATLDDDQYYWDYSTPGCYIIITTVYDKPNVSFVQIYPKKK